MGLLVQARHRPLLALLLLALIAAVPISTPAVVVGELHWTRISTCEHEGTFLQYYITDGCCREMFFYGDLPEKAEGRTIWANGRMLTNGGCTILDISDFELCPPEPPEPTHALLD